VFCPQCGNRVGGAFDESDAAVTPHAEVPTRAQSNLIDEAARVATTLNEKLPTLSQKSHDSGKHKVAPETERKLRAQEIMAEASGAQVLQPSEREEIAPAAAAQAETRGRMRPRATSVGENLRPRAEQLRKASTIVFDEASDDPGVRFVIVAVVLLLLSIFILLCSYILG
jgi:hypothetical protein